MPDWLRWWGEMSGPITEQSKAKTKQTRISVDSQLEIAPAKTIRSLDFWYAESVLSSLKFNVWTWFLCTFFNLFYYHIFIYTCKGETNDVSICNILSEPIIKQKYLSLEKHGKIIGVNQGKCRFSPIRLARDSSIRSISNSIKVRA